MPFKNILKITRKKNSQRLMSEGVGYAKEK